MEDDFFVSEGHADCDWFDGLNFDPSEEPTNETLALIEAELFG